MRNANRISYLSDYNQNCVCPVIRDGKRGFFYTFVAGLLLEDLQLIRSALIIN